MNDKKQNKKKQKVDIRECAQLFWIWFKIGSVLFGGGYAILPFLQREFVDKRKWTTEEEIADIFAIGQCTPGIIAVNTATFIGYKRQRIPGGILATLGVILPSIIIITLIAALLTQFMDIPIVQNAFAGIRVAVAALIVSMVVKFIKSGVKCWFDIGIYVVSLVVGLIFDINPVFIVIAAGIIGLVFRRKEVQK